MNLKPTEIRAETESTPLLISTNTLQSGEGASDVIEVDFEPGDPSDPLNWPKWRKWTIVGTTTLVTASV